MPFDGFHACEVFRAIRHAHCVERVPILSHFSSLERWWCREYPLDLQDVDTDTRRDLEHGEASVEGPGAPPRVSVAHAEVQHKTALHRAGADRADLSGRARVRRTPARPRCRTRS